jgi:hypothetical protein
VLRLARKPRQGAGAVRRAAEAVAVEEGRGEGFADRGVGFGSSVSLSVPLNFSLYVSPSPFFGVRGAWELRC